MRIVEQTIEIEWTTPYALQVIERAGRTCYKSESVNSKETAEEFVSKIVASGHHSVTEHAVASFRINTSRGMTHELVRHRAGMSYSQSSTRYCNFSNDKFGNEISVIPPSGLNKESLACWLKSCQEAETQYLRMLEAGSTPQIARSVLPICLQTEIVVTGNMRAWRHFLELRLAKGAHPDMRILAKMIYDELMKTECACIFADLGKLYEA